MTLHFCPICGRTFECVHQPEAECKTKCLCDTCLEAKKIEEKYAFAGKIVRLIEDATREILPEQARVRDARGQAWNTKATNLGSDPINWNWAVMTMQTDGLEEMIVCDIYRCPVRYLRDGTVDVDPRIRERIGDLFAQHKLLVAELELGGLRYGTQA